MYEKEFEEGLSRLNPEIAAMFREAHRQAIQDGEIEGMILMAGCEEGEKAHEEEKKRKQEVMEMIDKAVEKSKKI